MHIENTLRRLVAELLEIEPDSIRPEDTIDDLGGTPWDAISLVVHVEDQFLINIDDDAWDKRESFADYLKLVTETIGRIQ